MKHKRVSKQCGLKGCRFCAAYLIQKYYESRLTDIERMRLEEILR